MNLAEREQKIHLLRSNIRKNKRLLKKKLLNMKGGTVYDKWKAKYDECLDQKKRALEQMKKILISLETDLDLDRVKFARTKIKKQMAELQEEIDEMKISK